MKRIQSVNFHIWRACNFKCKFCFATYNDSAKLFHQKAYLTKDEMLKVIEEIVKSGEIEKITFAGGEPLLCKWLGELLEASKKNGLTTMLVTNGYLLSSKWLNKNSDNLDWVTLSIDTLNIDKQFLIGRTDGKRTISKLEYENKIESIKNEGCRFKMNTVVCSLNKEEDFLEFVLKVNPERWKIFQVLPMEGQNNLIADNLIITKSEFQKFIKAHKSVEEYGIKLIGEDNDEMTESYLMIDPLGRFYDNLEGRHSYSDSILDVGYERAIRQVRVSRSKFLKRGGEYDW